MSDLLNLADRVEASTGVDNVLNRAVARAMGWGYQTPSEARRKNPAWFHPEDCRNGKPVFDSLHGTDMWREPLPYLTSLDAAMTLVPEGWTFANLSQSDSKGWWCELRHGYLTSYDKVALGRQLENASPARALTAASLRAIHARGCADGENDRG